MELTVEDMIERLDEIIEAIINRDDMFVSLEVAQQLRDELLQHVEDFEDY